MCLVPIKRVNADIATIYGGYMTLCWLGGVKRSRESQILYLYNDNSMNHLWQRTVLASKDFKKVNKHSEQILQTLESLNLFTPRKLAGKLTAGRGGFGLLIRSHSISFVVKSYGYFGWSQGLRLSQTRLGSSRS